MQILTKLEPRIRKEIDISSKSSIDDGKIKPIVVYYSHMEDSRHILPNWKIRRDYTCCIMAKNISHAIEKTENIALSQPGARFIKILGVVPGKIEWVNEKEPLTQNPHINIKNPL